jgi:acyl-CoA thioesterase-2
VGDLLEDLHLDGSDGCYRGRVSPDWVIVQPNGGFLSSLALRAAGAESPKHTPASLSVHYLNVPTVDTVDIEVTMLRSSRRARSMRVSITQQSTPVLEALVWTTAEQADGLTHEIATMPQVPGPDEIPQWNPRAGEPMPDDLTPFWGNMDARMYGWPVGQRWEERTPGAPIRTEWNRFRPRATFDDPFVDAARSVILIDTLMLTAAMLAYREPMTHMGVSLDLSVWFHREAIGEEWLLCEAVSPVAGSGVVAGSARIWTQDGRLVASGGQQNLARRITSLTPQDLQTPFEASTALQ